MKGCVQVTKATKIEYMKAMIENEIFIKKQLIEKMEAALTLNDDDLKEWFMWAKEKNIIKD